MRRDECVDFLRWALPGMGFRWPGFRKVRGQVCKRIDRRLAELGLETVTDYRRHLECHPDEWSRLDAMCRITISRFYRDRAVFDTLGETVLPVLARRARDEGRALEAWSAGCASGEEPYSLTILWNLRLQEEFEDVGIEILATDADPLMLERARRARYPESSLRDLPTPWVERAFERRDSLFELLPSFRTGVRLEQTDLREAMPPSRFDLLLCRNLPFTYFALPTQEAILGRLTRRLRPGGSLVIGSHEQLPPTKIDLDPWIESMPIFRRSE